MKILTFAASSSKNSINKQLVSYAAGLIEGATIDFIDINDYEMPLFSVDREAKLGHPQLAQDFRQKIAEADGVLISFAEHNASYSAAYKNLFDWASRIEGKVYQDKISMYLSTSPGPGGAGNVLAAAKGSAPHFGAILIADLSVPKFNANFDTDKGKLSNPDLDRDLRDALNQFVLAIRGQ